MKRKQFAALPYRLGGGGTEILLITTRKKQHWSIPKGWPMKGRKPHAAAAIEAFEEAGVVGEISRKRLGHYRHQKRQGARDIECAVEIYPLAVRRKLNRWPEQEERKRRWFSSKKAARRVKAKGLRRAICVLRDSELR